jgi:hypothetical protein
MTLESVSCIIVGLARYHVFDILSTTLKGMRLSLVVNADEKGLLADVLPVVGRVLAV